MSLEFVDDDDDRSFAYDTKGQVMAKNTSTATKKAEFTHDNKDYRVIAIGKYSSGYSDSLLVQVKDQDVMGDVVWRDFTVQSNVDNKEFKLIEMIVALAQKARP